MWSAAEWGIPEVSKLCLGCDFWYPQLWGVTPSQGVLGAVTPPGIKEQKSCRGEKGVLEASWTWRLGDQDLKATWMFIWPRGGKGSGQKRP